MEAVARATGRRLVIDAGALAMVEARHAGIAVNPATRRDRPGEAGLPPRGGGRAPSAGDRARLPPGARRAGGRRAARAALGARGHVGGRAGRARSWPPSSPAPATRASACCASTWSPSRGSWRSWPTWTADAWDRLHVGICARDAELEVTVRSAPGDVWAADALEEHLAAALGDALYSRDDTTVDEVVARALVTAGQTVAVAESCTGGGLGKRLTERAGSLRLHARRGDLVPRRGQALGARGRPGGDPPRRSRLRRVRATRWPRGRRAWSEATGRSR